MKDEGGCRNVGLTGRVARFRRVVASALGAVVAIVCCGCPPYADPYAPEPIQRLTEPSTESKYLLYVPSGYDAEKPAALVILCHGTKPWDNPDRQIRDWVRLAEEETFIVAAPNLVGTRGDFPPPPEKQITLQREDEETILSVVRHVQGAYNIPADRIFLAGWSAGNYAVLYTGMKNPLTFRALAVIQGNFNEQYLGEVAKQVDRYQPILVLYSSADVLTGEHGKRCVDWLYDQDAYVFEDLVAGSHRGHPQQAFEFFRKVVRTIPWLHVRAFTPGSDEPYTVQFKTRGSFEPSAYVWTFGDGESSPIASPTHTFSAPGEYTVTLVAQTPSGSRVKRSIQVTVPVTVMQHDLANM